MKVNDYCLTCKYRGLIKFNGRELACDYMLITGKPRGCPAGPGCSKRERGAREKEPLTLTPKEAKT